MLAVVGSCKGVELDLGQEVQWVLVVVQQMVHLLLELGV